MAINQTDCSRLEKRSFIKFLVAEKCKTCEMYRRMYDVIETRVSFEKNNALQIG